MKEIKILLILLCITFEINILAQNNNNYTPLITDKNKEWKTIATYYPYQRTYLQGDTIIEGLKCRHIYVDYIGLPDLQNISMGAVVEVDKKVWIYSFDRKLLLYDFTLEKEEGFYLFGDTTRSFLTVTDIDSVQINNGDWRKRWFLDSSSGAYYDDIWIEGIGSFSGVLDVGGNSFLIDGSQYRLAQAKAEEEIIYCDSVYAAIDYSELDESFSDFVENCRQLVSSTSSVTSISTIQLTAFPSPFQEQTTISFTLPKNTTTSLHLYNQVGQKVATLHDNKHFSAGQYHSQLRLDDAANGIYYAVLSLDGQQVVSQKVVLMR